MTVEDVTPLAFLGFQYALEHFRPQEYLATVARPQNVYCFKREISESNFSLFRLRWSLPPHNRVRVPILSICS
jgi:hypothetical protein